MIEEEKQYWKLQEILKMLDTADKATLLAVKKYIETTLKEVVVE